MNDLKQSNAGVAAGHEETAKAAIETLDAGGNAFDAVIAGFLAACVAEPVLASLGGGGFLLAHVPNKPTRAFDFFTQTPNTAASPDNVDFHAITADFGTAQQEFHIGLGAVATPGAVAGIFEIHNELGQLPMMEIVKPAARLARSGLLINEFQSYLLTVVEPIYQETQASKKLFCRGALGGGNNEIMVAGDRYASLEFGDFLEALAIEGPDLFYKGEVAEQISNFSGCAIDKSDLAGYRVVQREPIETNLHNHRIFINPPPAIGGSLIALALSLLNEEPQNDLKFGTARQLQQLVSVMAKCNTARIDSDIDLDPIGGASRLNDFADHPPAYNGTTHISIADSNGNVAAMTVSNGEGCGTIIPGTGIMLNNMLGEEDLNAAGFFNWPLDTRMSSMMSPGVITSKDGQVIGFGSGGSNRIRSAITQFIANTILFDMDLADAIMAPRLHLEGDKIDIEPGFPIDAIETLSATYPVAKVWPETNMFFGGVHAIQCDIDGNVQGAADPRRGGVFTSL